MSEFADFFASQSGLLIVEPDPDGDGFRVDTKGLPLLKKYRASFDDLAPAFRHAAKAAHEFGFYICIKLKREIG